MLSIAPIIAAFTLLLGADAEQNSPDVQALVVPRFSGFPVREQYTGPAATPKFKSASERDYLEALLGRTALEPNFAGQFRIVQFQMGSGPIGAALVESKTGSVFRLPREIAENNFFIHGTDCLSALRGLPWAKADDEEDASAPLSFKKNSELLVVRQCRVDGTTVTAVERSYYRWHGRKWHFLRSLAGPPPPVF